MERMKSNTNINNLSHRDVAIYITLFLVIVWSFTLVPIGWLEKATAEASSNTLSVLGFSSGWGVQEDEAFIMLAGGERNVRVTIIRECTAVNVFAVLVGLILPLKRGVWFRKMLSILSAGLILFLLNVSRIMLTVVLTGFDVPPFSWFFTNPTIEVYHYPISFIYGVVGVALLVLIINRWILVELGDTFIGLLSFFKQLFSSLKL